MAAETDLKKLLAALSPRLMDGEHVFCTFPHARYGDYPELEPVAAVEESEGLTLVIPKSKADQRSLNYELVFKGITLNVHSSLKAVGLTAAVASKLAECGVSANVIAGYYHDHIFVESADAEKAVEALNELGH